jgi:DUF438 domain-containing protein
VDRNGEDLSLEAFTPNGFGSNDLKKSLNHQENTGNTESSGEIKKELMMLMGMISDWDVAAQKRTGMPGTKGMDGHGAVTWQAVLISFDPTCLLLVATV